MSRRGDAKSTLAICETGTYTAPSGEAFDLRADIEAARRGTRLYTPADVASLHHGVFANRAAFEARFSG